MRQYKDLQDLSIYRVHYNLLIKETIMRRLEDFLNTDLGVWSASLLTCIVLLLAVWAGTYLYYSP